MKRTAVVVFSLGLACALGLVGGYVFFKYDYETKYQTFIEPVYRSTFDGTGVDDNSPGQMRVEVYKKNNIGWKGADGGTEFLFTKENGKWKSTHTVWYLEERISGMAGQTLSIGTNQDVPLQWQPIPFDELRISMLRVVPYRCSATAEILGNTKEETARNAKEAVSEIKNWIQGQHFICPG